MSVFENFQKLYGTGSNCNLISKNYLNVNLDFPSELLSFFQDKGLCTYINGFLSLVDPIYFKEVISEWVDESLNPKVFARTALADLIILIKGNICILRVQYGELFIIENDINRFFNVLLCDQEFLNDTFDYKLFLKTKEYLPSSPSIDECYAYVPVLALGGSGSPKTMKVVKIKEYLYMLSQIVLENGSIKIVS